jgi:hypothetical protein
MASIYLIYPGGKDTSLKSNFQRVPQWPSVEQKPFGAKMKREPETWKMAQNAIKEYEEEGFSRRQ